MQIIRCLMSALFLIAASGVATSAPAWADGEISSGDRIAVSVFQEPAYSGEFSVRDNGAIVINGIGRIPVQGIMPSNVEEVIAERLAKLGVAGAVVTVDVVSRRPVIVFGDVERPGEYPFSANMTVLTAIARAGGYPRILRDENRRISAAREWQRRQDIQLRIAAAEARLKRIDLEESGGPLSTKQAGVFSDNETKIALANKAERELELAVLNEQKKALEQQVESLRAVVDARQKDLDLATAQVTTQTDLFQRQLTSQARVFETKRAEVQSSIALFENQAALGRAFQNSAEVSLRIAQLNNPNSASRAMERRDVVKELEMLRKEFDSTTSIINLYGSLEASRASEDAEPMRLEVIRQDNGASALTQVDEQFELKPGDIVRVTSPTLTPSRARVSSAGAP